MPRKTPSYKGLKPASEKASKAARGSSKKTDTKPEILLRKALWKAGLRYRKNVKDLPGKPDIVFSKEKLVVFIDGDFWHGKDWKERKSKLQAGNNPGYWVKKISSNIDRDMQNKMRLEQKGWTVFRFWESEVKSDIDFIKETILNRLNLVRYTTSRFNQLEKVDVLSSNHRVYYSIVENRLQRLRERREFKRGQGTVLKTSKVDDECEVK